MTIPVTAAQSLRLSYCLQPLVEYSTKRVYFAMDRVVFESVTDVLRCANWLRNSGEHILADLLTQAK